MIKINDLVTNNLEVNWTTILLGWTGFKNVQRILDVQDIIDYAIHLASDGADDEDIFYLAGLEPKDEEEITNTISLLSKKEKYNNHDMEIRKWRLLLLKDKLQDINKSPLYGLIELTDFWSQFDYPQDSPHIIQGKDNDVEPNDYYTEENYYKILSIHHDWVQKEKKRLS